MDRQRFHPFSRNKILLLKLFGYCIQLVYGINMLMNKKHESDNINSLHNFYINSYNIIAVVVPCVTYRRVLAQENMGYLKLR